MTEPKQIIFTDDWITLRQAAELMHVCEKDLRRQEKGRFVFAPQFARIRVSPKRNAKILFSLAEVLKWREAQHAAARAFTENPVAAALQPSHRGFQDLADELRDLNVPRRALAGLGIR